MLSRNPDGDGAIARRVEALTEAGPSSYLVPAHGGVAPAGDTVEIVRVASGAGKSATAGLWIRASARFCAAYQEERPPGQPRTLTGCATAK